MGGRRRPERQDQCREDSVEGDRNGLWQLLPFLECHKPLDIVIVMLGTNDLKPRFSPQPYDIARGVQRAAMTIQDSRTGPGNTSPKVIIVRPPSTAGWQRNAGSFFWMRASTSIPAL